jgi:hypothetical protein
MRDAFAIGNADAGCAIESRGTGIRDADAGSGMRGSDQGASGHA